MRKILLLVVLIALFTYGGWSAVFLGISVYSLIRSRELYRFINATWQYIQRLPTESPTAQDGESKTDAPPKRVTVASVTASVVIAIVALTMLPILIESVNEAKTTTATDVHSNEPANVGGGFTPDETSNQNQAEPAPVEVGSTSVNAVLDLLPLLYMVGVLAVMAAAPIGFKGGFKKSD